MQFGADLQIGGVKLPVPGGRRAKALTKSQRSDIAKKAVAKRPAPSARVPSGQLDPVLRLECQAAERGRRWMHAYVVQGHAQEIKVAACLNVGALRWRKK
jgi:hypothetical protein